MSKLEGGDNLHAQSGEIDPEVVDYYANFVGCNVTPFELNLIFGRAAMPVNALANEQHLLSDNVKYLARVALPLRVMPLLLRILEGQIKFAEQAGFFEVPAEVPEKVEP